jgi:hypothetical protein
VESAGRGAELRAAVVRVGVRRAIGRTGSERARRGRIFVSADGGAQWAAESSFPHAITEALALGNTARGRALFAFTHGRGAWRVELEPAPRRRAVSR